MAVQLNHTIVHARDKHASAAFLAEILGLPAPTTFGPFAAVRVTNDVTLYYEDVDEPPTTAHYAFLLTEAEFDEVFGRITARGLDHWADPLHRLPGQINTDDGGRGVYFDDPDGHRLEIITRPYGGN
jgi:catechol 2,3-dioxygenase-like lactoylglutathione lyase family enzyme